MIRSPWDVLGLERGADAKDVRRAYARLLKETNPEDDQQGFVELRSAYEAVMAESKPGQDVVDPEPDVERSPLWHVEQATAPHDPYGSASDPAPGPDSTDPLLEAEIVEIRSRISRLAAAIQAQAAPEIILWEIEHVLSASGLSSMQVAHDVEMWIAQAVVNLPASYDPVIVAIADRFDWGDDDFGTISPAVDAVLHRLGLVNLVSSLSRPGSTLSAAWRLLTADAFSAGARLKAFLSDNTRSAIPRLVSVIERQTELLNYVNHERFLWARTADARRAWGLTILPIPLLLIWSLFQAVFNSPVTGFISIRGIMWEGSAQFAMGGFALVAAGMLMVAYMEAWRPSLPRMSIAPGGWRPSNGTVIISTILLLAVAVLDWGMYVVSDLLSATSNDPKRMTAMPTLLMGCALLFQDHLFGRGEISLRAPERREWIDLAFVACLLLFATEVPGYRIVNALGVGLASLFGWWRAGILMRRHDIRMPMWLAIPFCMAVIVLCGFALLAPIVGSDDDAAGFLVVLLIPLSRAAILLVIEAEASPFMSEWRWPTAGMMAAWSVVMMAMVAGTQPVPGVFRIRMACTDATCAYDSNSSTTGKVYVRDYKQRKWVEPVLD